MRPSLNIQPTGKNIIVTGGYGHLGAALCEALAANDAQVYVFGRSQEKHLEAFKNSENKQSIHLVRVDIASDEEIDQGFKMLEEKQVQIHGIINNAVYLRGQSPETMSREDFNFALDGCLASVYSMIKHALPYLSAGASIVNVSSMYGMVAPDFDVYKTSPEFLNPPHYGAAKAGVIQLTKYYASYLGERDIRVNAVSPGPFPSTGVQEKESFIHDLNKHTLLDRIGQPEELAGVFVFLMSDAARYITGQNFVIDGGWTSK